MDTLNVRIVKLEPQRVAASYGFGQGPEEIAWQKMAAFVQEKGLEHDGQEHRYFGFNNPSPSAGSPNYGYEQWITVGPAVEPSQDIKIKTFEGGWYAVTTCTLSHITEVWHALAAWREQSEYRPGSHQWLEEALNPQLGAEIDPDTLRLDLYLPIHK